MRKVLVLATACLLMTSCVIDKREMVSAEDQYNKEFVKLFGETDPNHTWSMVENKKVEVNLTKPSNVKVYVKSGENYHLAADYQDVSGSQQLSFDAPMGCEDVYVTVDGVPYQVVGSRTAIDPKTVVTAMTNENGESVYVPYKFGDIKMFKKDNEPTSILPEQRNNMDKVKMDYEVISNGQTYKFYPLFWNADYEHTFGVYYYDGEGEQPKKVEFYTDKMGGEECYLQYKNSQGEWTDVTTDYAYEDIFAQQGLTDDTEVLRGRYFTINLPEGTKFGFFVNVSEGGSSIGTYYSNPALNEPHKSFSSFSYLQTGGDTYITIEDHTDLDFDYNDFIFIMEGTRKPIINDPIEYIYAVEDLGNKDDFDFNDVVFSVSHISGQPHANVKLLAAGGTLPAWICFNGTSDETDFNGTSDQTDYSFKGVEVHEMFGVDTNVMVNTDDGTTKANMKPGKSFVVQVPVDWSHAAFSTEGNGFGVMVQNEDNVTHVTPGNHSAPQILILPENWLWPTERTRIDAAYSGFSEWGENYTNSDWVNTRDYSKVVDWVGAPQTNQ